MSRWFRMYDDVLNDPKVQCLPGDLFKAWVNILCFASKNGEPVLRSLDELAFALRMSLEMATEITDKLAKYGLLDQGRGGYSVHNWDGRQRRSDVSTNRVQKFRERTTKPDETVSRNADGNGNATATKRDVKRTETVQEKNRTDSEVETEQKENQNLAAASEIKPASPSTAESPLAAADKKSKYDQIADAIFPLLPSNRTDWKVLTQPDISPIVQVLEAGLNLHDDIVPMLREKISKIAGSPGIKVNNWHYFRPQLEELASTKKAAEKLDETQLNGHAVEPAKIAAGPDWDRLVRDFKEGGRWLLGHDPNSPACDAPLAIRQKYGYGLPRVYDPWVVFPVNAGKVWAAAGLERPTDVDVVKEWRDLGYDAKISLAVIEVAVKAGARTLTECSNAVIRANETIAEGAS